MKYIYFINKISILFALIMNKNYKIDNIDFKILNILSEDAKIPYTEVAKKISVSSGTIHVRIKKMEEMGIIKGTTLKIDYCKIGYDITCFLGIYLEKSSLYDQVVGQLKKIKEVATIRYTTGDYNIFCKIYCKDTQHLKDVLHDEIQKVKGIESTETFISLEESINKHLTF